MKVEKKYTSNTKSIQIELEKKKCEGHNCAEYFMVKWPTARRCDRCRREKRPYKSEDNPF